MVFKLESVAALQKPKGLFLSIPLIPTTSKLIQKNNVIKKTIC